MLTSISTQRIEHPGLGLSDVVLDPTLHVKFFLFQALQCTQVGPSFWLAVTTLTTSSRRKCAQPTSISSTEIAHSSISVTMILCTREWSGTYWSSVDQLILESKSRLWTRKLESLKTHAGFVCLFSSNYICRSPTPETRELWQNVPEGIWIKNAVHLDVTRPKKSNW